MCCTAHTCIGVGNNAVHIIEAVITKEQQQCRLQDDVEGGLHLLEAEP